MENNDETRNNQPPPPSYSQPPPPPYSQTPPPQPYSQTPPPQPYSQTPPPQPYLQTPPPTYSQPQTLPSSYSQPQTPPALYSQHPQPTSYSELPQPMTYSQLPHTASFNPVLYQENPQLREFWIKEMETLEDFKTHKLPLARIKKIMKADQDVKMIATEAPKLFDKACEIFIHDLMMRSWIHAEENKRHTLTKPDIIAAVSHNLNFDFLLDIVPRDESLTADSGVMAMPYYYPPGIATGNSEIDGSEMYVQQDWADPWAVETGDGEEEAGNNGENHGGQ